MLPLAILALALLCLPGISVGQDSFESSGFGQSNDLFGGGDISFGGLGVADSEPVTWKAEYFTAGKTGRIEIEASVGHSWHIYSTTQPSGGPLRTKFKIESPDSVSITGKFKPDSKPTQSISDLYPGVTIEEHEGVTRWTAAIKIADGFKGPIKVDVSALVCQNGGSCVPANETLVAKFSGPVGDAKVTDSDKATDAKTSADDLLADPAAKPTTFRDDGYEVTWVVGVSQSIAAGDQGQLIFNAKPEHEYHVYQSVVDDSESATNFVVVEKKGLLVGKPITDQPLVASKSISPPIPGLPVTPPVKYYKGPVTWSVPIKVPAGTDSGDYKISGFVCYQACTDKSCLPPQAFKFAATIKVTDQTNKTIQGVEIKSTKFRDAIDVAAETDWVDDFKLVSAAATAPSDATAGPADTTTTPESADDSTQQVSPKDAAAALATVPDPAADSATSRFSDTAPKASMPLILLMALGAGLILNLMPCVLPVLGIKVMSIVQQAGEDRKRIFVLNFAYVAGILAVFAGLTLLGVFFSFGWGQQFTYFPVRLGLTVLIFALALSYLGLWELPTPGVATSDASQGLQDKEGFTGAFFKGAFATVLATPCSGPLLGVVLAYTISLPPLHSAAVMMTVGLGMSLPYVFLGLFPAAISFMPKPGNWMVTLKEFLAFLFLGTVAFFFSQFSDGDKLPVFVTLIGVWFGFWIIGKVPPWESLGKQLRGWALGLTSAAAIGWFSFAYLADKPPVPSETGDGIQYIVENHVRWEKYDEQRLAQLQSEGKTVMLDFTAAWCVNCKWNTKVALDTEATMKQLERLGAVAMLADWTDGNERITSKLNELNSKSIPVLAIFPGKNHSKPIILRDIISQTTVLDALQEAGPSRTDPADPTVVSATTDAQRFTSTVATQPNSSATQNH